MSEKPIAIFVSTLIAAPLMVVCCGIGPIAFFALVSGAITGGVTSFLGTFDLPAIILIASMTMIAVLVARNWLKTKQKTLIERSENI